MKFCLKFAAAVLACGVLVGCGGEQVAHSPGDVNHSPQNPAAMGENSSESATNVESTTSGSSRSDQIGSSNPDGKSTSVPNGSQPGIGAGAATNAIGSSESSPAQAATQLSDSGRSQPGSSSGNEASAKASSSNSGLVANSDAQNSSSSSPNTTEGSDNRKVSMPQFNELSERESYVILKKGTERAFTGEYWATKDPGTYICRRCNAPLYKSDDKFDSECGWPSFDDEVKGAVRREVDADGRRTEIICANCGGHLGHVFLGERFTDKNTRHCVNSLSIKLIPKGTELPPVIKVPESK